MELVRVSVSGAKWTAPKSLMVYRKTSSVPAHTALAAWGAAHRPEHRRRAAPEQPGALLQRRRELAEAGHHRQVHIRVGEQGDHVQRPPEPLEGRQSLHPEGLQQPGQQPTGGEGGQ